MSQFPHAICPGGFTDEAEQCDCLFATSPLDEIWQPLESHDDEETLEVRCRCRVCDREEWLKTPLMTVLAPQQ